MQGALDTTSRSIQPNASLLEKWNFAGCGPSCVRVGDPALPASACGPACEPVAYRGTFHALRTIARQEGPGVLWRGTDVAMMMAIPMVGIYLPLYDYMLEGMQQNGVGGYSPLIAGSLARMVAVFCTSPFELVRTRMQAVKAAPVTPAGYGVAPARGPAPVPRLLQHLPMQEGASRLSTLRTLWTGVGATLARDVPFSALYWALVEPIRASLLPPTGARSELEVMSVNVTAGGTAGALSGAITTPLDVVKTRTQLAMGEERSVMRTLRSILRTEGLPGLYQGWSARAAKAAPACAIVLSAYEMLKFLPEE